jgi:HPr kinase/phosphorylase
VTLEPPVLVLADRQVAPPSLLSMCERAQLPMFSTASSSAFVIDVLRAYLSKHFADRCTMHGVFMDILGLGVMITGESGLGKSELGLELISRGNGLVADDAVDLYRINQDTIEGRCPELLLNLLEVRGIGLLDIRCIFGETAVRRKKRLQLIVHLVRRETLERDYERIPHEPLTQDVLDVPVRKVVIQVVAGRNIAVLVEAAVRNTILQIRGVDTYKEFVERHRKAMEASPEPADRNALAAMGAIPLGAVGVQTERVVSNRETLGTVPPRSGAFRSGRRKTPPPARSPGTPGGRGAALR